MKSENILKGQIAKTLVEELFKKAGYKIHRLCQREVIQDFFGQETELAKKITSIPDFVVFPLQGEPLLLEVKFRTDPEALEEELLLEKSLEEFWKAKILLVTSREKPYFRVLDPPYFKEDKREGWPVPIFNWKPLDKDETLKIDKKRMFEFERLVEKYYK